MPHLRGACSSFTLRESNHLFRKKAVRGKRGGGGDQPFVFPPDKSSVSLGLVSIFKTAILGGAGETLGGIVPKGWIGR